MTTNDDDRRPILLTLWLEPDTAARVLLAGAAWMADHDDAPDPLAADGPELAAMLADLLEWSALDYVTTFDALEPDAATVAALAGRLSAYWADAG